MSGHKRRADKHLKRLPTVQMDSLFATNNPVSIGEALVSLQERFGAAVFTKLETTTGIKKGILKALAREERETLLTNPEYNALAKAAKRLVMN